MSLASLALFKPVNVQIIDPSNSTVYLTFDVSLSETHQTDVEVTEHHIEQGAVITDHARPKPAVVTLEGLISNTPIKNLIQTGGALFVKGSAGPVEDAYRKLLFLKDNAKLSTIITKLATYKNMLLFSLTVPRDAKIGDTLKFTAIFKEIRQVTLQTIALPPTKQPRGKGKKNLGKKQPAPATPPAANRSILTGAVNMFVKKVVGPGVTPPAGP